MGGQLFQNAMPSSVAWPAPGSLLVDHHQLALHLARSHARIGGVQLGHGHGAIDHGLDLSLAVPLRQLLHHGRIGLGLDRKSTRLNSSHLVISYAVFCLKKKKRLGYYLSVPT